MNFQLRQRVKEKATSHSINLPSMESLILPCQHCIIIKLMDSMDESYTGWPRKNATPTITNFEEIRD